MNNRRNFFTVNLCELVWILLISATFCIRCLRPDSSTINDVETTRKHHGVYKGKSNRTRNYSPKKILIFGEFNKLKGWVLLNPMTNCFKGQHTKSLRACSVFCTQYKESILLTLGGAEKYAGKDAIVFGVTPKTLHNNHDEAAMKQFPSSVLTVFYSMESPYMASKWIWKLHTGRYHITMTYHTGSNITIPYSYYKPFTEKKLSEKQNFAMGKTRLIAWMGSNCVNQTFWPRMEYIKQLQTHISIDMYGKCGNLTCLPRLSVKCVHMMKKYKFYLSFENSECHEYLTEKFWTNALRNNVVPIVYGPNRSDYHKFAPPNSYIHVSDFKNVQELADYIKLLDKNDDLYNKYFDWIKMGMTVNVFPQLKPSYFCELLPFLGKNQSQERKPLSQSAWFNSCRNPIKNRYKSSKWIHLKNWSPWR
ncbi:glycoprotein 3-alpha-L-fucosyltransferase A-like [Anneissia japonica]|uniref:glycoprotein 3-alpha-L-fucosyltransferase A-like n=1 Tax=Anneissia japonica TaxID=1529436 RepID=UPI0014256529|nr:glycoprotein 3-alpha-L-fucosyltransferase A-like [Anneissia japonica]